MRPPGSSTRPCLRIDAYRIRRRGTVASGSGSGSLYKRAQAIVSNHIAQVPRGAPPRSVWHMRDARIRHVDHCEAGIQQAQAVVLFLAIKVQRLQIPSEPEEHAAAEQVRETDVRRHVAGAGRRRRLHRRRPRCPVRFGLCERDGANVALPPEHIDAAADRCRIDDVGVVVHQQHAFVPGQANGRVPGDDRALPAWLDDHPQLLRDGWRRLGAEIAERLVARVVDDEHFVDHVFDERERGQAPQAESRDGSASRSRR